MFSPLGCTPDSGLLAPRLMGRGSQGEGGEAKGGWPLTGTTCAPNPGHQARGPGGEAAVWRGVRTLLPVLTLTLSCGHIPRPLACWPSYSDGALPADLPSSFTSGPSSGRCLRSYQESSSCPRHTTAPALLDLFPLQ